MTSPRRVISKICVAAALAAAPFAGAAQQSLPDGNYLGQPSRTQIFDAMGELRVLSNVALPTNVKQAFDSEFGDTIYFGAFAISKDLGYGYSVGANTLGAARAIALSNCAAVNDQCRIIAEIVPRGFTGPEPGAISLSNEVAEYYLNASSYAAFRAMAVSADGAYSLNWGLPTQAAANDRAMLDCESYRNTANPDVIPMPCLLIPDLP